MTDIILFDGAAKEVGMIPIESPMSSPTKFFNVKVAGVWRECITWVKVAGVWKQATPFVKVDGDWV
jgi:hypothetical protein